MEITLTLIGVQVVAVAAMVVAVAEAVVVVTAAQEPSRHMAATAEQEAVVVLHLLASVELGMEAMEAATAALVEMVLVAVAILVAVGG